MSDGESLPESDESKSDESDGWVLTRSGFQSAYTVSGPQDSCSAADLCLTGPGYGPKQYHESRQTFLVALRLFLPDAFP